MQLKSSWLIATTLAIGSLGLANAGWFQLNGAPQADALPPIVRVDNEDDLSEFTPEEQINIRVYESVNRSVVHIRTRTLPRETIFMFEQATEGSGSGSVLDQQGHILTNYHVIRDSDDIRVTLFNGETYPAQVIGVDPPNDTAVIKIVAPPESLIPVRFGSSQNLRVGQKIYAIGNPFGLDRTMTEGIISSLNRTLPARGTDRTMKSIIQLDAALNQGNSGGPLLNTRGQLIGMNTAIASRVGENSGVGFAIPVNTLSRVVPQLIEKGRVIRADLGVIKTWPAPDGLGIAVIDPDSAAEKAGLRGIRMVIRQERRGLAIIESRSLDFDYSDRIVAVDGQPIETFDELLSAVETKQPGDRVDVSILREGRRIVVPVTLGVDQ